MDVREIIPTIDSMSNDDIDSLILMLTDFKYNRNTLVEQSIVNQPIMEQPEIPQAPQVVTHTFEEELGILDDCRNEFCDIFDKLIKQNDITEDDDVAIYNLSVKLCDLYNDIGDHNIIRTKITIYNNALVNLANTRQVGYKPYSEIAHIICDKLLECLTDLDWFKTYMNITNINELQYINVKAIKNSWGDTRRKQKCINKLNINVDQLDRIIAVFHNYAYHFEQVINTGNETDKYIMLAADRCLTPLLKLQDEDDILQTIVQKYLYIMEQYDLSY